MENIFLTGQSLHEVETLSRMLHGLDFQNGMDQEVQQVNEYILNLLEGDCKNPPRLERGWWMRPELMVSRTQAKYMLRREQDKIYIYSDTCTGYTIPFWQEVCSTPKFIFLVQDPYNSAMEQQEEEPELSLEEGVKRWLRYMLAVKTARVSQDRHMVLHKDNFSEQQSAMDELRRVVTFVGAEQDIPFLENKLKKVTSELVLVKNAAKFEMLYRLQLNSDLVRLIEETYEDYCVEAERDIF